MPSPELVQVLLQWKKPEGWNPSYYIVYVQTPTGNTSEHPGILVQASTVHPDFHPSVQIFVFASAPYHIEVVAVDFDNNHSKILSKDFIAPAQ